MRVSKRRRVRSDEEDAEEPSDVCSSGCCVYFYATVSSSNVLKLLTCLREANECAIKSTHLDNTPRVFLYIHSNGGDAFAGLSAMDHIRNNPVPVTTICDGMVASAATFMLLGSDSRRALRNSFVRIHQVSIYGFDGKYVDFVDEFQNTNTLMETVRCVYLENTRLSRKRLEEILKKELDMSAETCVTEGIVQSIVA